MMKLIESLETRLFLSISVSGNDVVIAPGDTTPSQADFTDYGPIGVAQGQVTRTYTIQNTGSVTTITGLNIRGLNSSDFTFVTAPQLNLTAGAQTQFTVRFDPNAEGLRSAYIQIDSSANPTVKYDIQGKGVNAVTQPDGLQIATTKAGTGEGAQTGQLLTVNYTGYLLDGTKFDSSLNPGREPFQLVLGVSSLITGWHEGLLGAKAGEDRVLIVPPSLGYGSTGQGSIPPNATLIFEISVLKIEPWILTMRGNGQVIPAADSTPQPGDNTDFGFTTPGNPVTKEFVLSTGNLGAVRVDDSTNPFSVSGADAARFVVNRYTVDGDDIHFTVTYTPDGVGMDSATVSFPSNNPLTPNYTFAIRGQMLSSGVSIDAGVVRIVGTAANDDIAIAPNGDSIQTWVGGIANLFPVSSVTRIEVSGGDGDDRVNVDVAISKPLILQGGNGNDSLSGGGGNDLLYGNDGNDIISGGDGVDTLYGNFGDDAIAGGLKRDSLLGGIGNDTITAGDGPDSVYGGDGTDSLRGGKGADYIEGKGKADTIYGGTEADTIYGQAGADMVYGEDGNDTLYVEDTFSDTVYGGGGTDSGTWDTNDSVFDVETDLLA